MKFIIVLAVSFQVSSALANCLRDYGCKPLRASERNLSVQKLEERGDACLAAAEVEGDRNGRRRSNACFISLDSAGVALHQKARWLENDQFIHEQEERQTSYQQEVERSSRERAEWERRNEQWRRECDAYRARWGVPCQ